MKSSSLQLYFFRLLGVLFLSDLYFSSTFCTLFEHFLHIFCPHFAHFLHTFCTLLHPVCPFFYAFCILMHPSCLPPFSSFFSSFWHTSCIPGAYLGCCCLVAHHHCLTCVGSLKVLKKVTTLSTQPKFRRVLLHWALFLLSNLMIQKSFTTLGSNPFFKFHPQFYMQLVNRSHFGT